VEESLFSVSECTGVRQVSGCYSTLVPLKFRWLLKSLNDNNHQIIIKFQWNWFKEVGQYMLR